MVLRFLSLLIGLSMAAALLPTPARAAEAVDSGLEALGRVVGDDQLEEMRGKFLSPDGVTFFGLSMESSWQTPDGVITSARLAVNIDFAASGGLNRNTVPQIYISWSREKADGSMDVARSSNAAAGGAIPIGGLGSVQGSVQSMQIAGTDNHVRNAMTVAIVPGAGSRIDTAGMTPVTGGSSQQFADGDKITFVVGGNQLGLVLTNGASDRVQQSINGNASQLAQHVLLGSNFNAIANGMNLTVGYDPQADARRISAEGAMSAMKSFGM